MEHKYVLISDQVEATCTETGSTALYRCTVCNGNLGGETIPLLEHNYQNGFCLVCGSIENPFNVDSTKILLTKHTIIGGRWLRFYYDDFLAQPLFVCINEYEGASNIELPYSGLYIYFDKNEEFYPRFFHGYDDIGEFSAPQYSYVLGDGYVDICIALGTLEYVDNDGNEHIYVVTESTTVLDMVYLDGTTCNNIYLLGEEN